MDKKRDTRYEIRVTATNWRWLVTIIGFIVAIVCCHCTAEAASISREMKKAERLYKEEKYDEALASYDMAFAKKPDDSRVQYNKGVVLYDKKEFTAAEEAFMEALSLGKEALEGKSMYNMGNARYRIAEGSVGTDPSAGVKSHKEALQYYRRAIELDPDDVDAKYNYEFTLKKMQAAQQEQQKQQQDEKQDQQENQDKDKEQQEDQGQGSGDKGQEKQDKQEQKDEDKEQGQESRDKEQEEQDQQQQEQQDQQKEERQQQQQQDQQEEQGEEQSQQQQQEDQKQDQMSEQEARMLLMAQEEEENRMRQEMKEQKKARRPQVLRDW